MNILTPKSEAERANRLLAYNAALAAVARDTMPAPGGAEFIGGGRITGYNASLFDQNNFSEELTSYALGYRDPNNIAETLQFVAPEVESPRKPEIAYFSSAEEFLSDGASDDLRAIGSDFATVRYDSDKLIKKLQNRGLAIELDEDEIEGVPDWEQKNTAKLLRRLDRNSLRRAIAMLAAGATNTNVTWSTAAGKNPDGDVRAELLDASDDDGIRANRVLYGDTAWDTRVASHEAQDNAGGYAAAGRTPEQVGAFLNVDVMVSKERYSTSAAATSLNEVVSNKVLMFKAFDDSDLEDPSNIKRLRGNVAARNGGGRVAVHVRQVGDKRWRLAVERYELIYLPATLGLRQFTTARS